MGKKHIKIKVTPLSHLNVDDWAVINIVEQSHRECEFGDDCNTFKCKKSSFKLTSDANPELAISDNTFYVRGYEKENDNTGFLVSTTELDTIASAVKEYNEYFSEHELCEYEDSTIPSYFVE